MTEHFKKYWGDENCAQKFAQSTGKEGFLETWADMGR